MGLISVNEHKFYEILRAFGTSIFMLLNDKLFFIQYEEKLLQGNKKRKEVRSNKAQTVNTVL